MGQQTAQVQSGQTSEPQGKTNSVNSGQPAFGQPNPNGNTNLQPVNAGFVPRTDGQAANDPYQNTISNKMGEASGAGQVKTPASKGKGG